MSVMNRIRIFPLVYFFIIAVCSSLTTPSAPSPTATEFQCAEPGSVQRVTADSETEVSLYLPPCYDRQPDQLFPVIYLFPGFGGTNGDFFGGGAERIADTLILARETPPFLIVATGEIFPDLDAKVVTGKILPFIEEHYRIRAERTFRAAAGGSFGGAVAYHLAFKQYDLFGSAGIFGNGAALGEEDSIRAWLAAIPAVKRPRVFINVGESDTYMLERAKILIPILDEAGIPHEEIFNPGKHSGDYWISNFAAYFRWLSVEWREYK